MRKIDVLVGLWVPALLGPAWANPAVQAPTPAPKRMRPRPAPLVLHYEFEKESPPIVKDLSGRENNGSVNGQSQLVSGIDGWAMRFDRVDDYIRVPRKAVLETKKITVAAWDSQIPDKAVHERRHRRAACLPCGAFQVPNRGPLRAPGRQAATQTHANFTPADSPKIPRWQSRQNECLSPVVFGTDVLGEVARHYQQGVRDKAASPEFLKAMKTILDRHSSSRLPFREDFANSTVAFGWQAVRDAWFFSDGYVSQTKFRHDTRFMLYYAPGREWNNYTFSCVAWADPYPMQQSDLRFYFRWQNPDNAYFLQCFDSGLVRLGIRQDGSERILASTNVEPKRAASKVPWTIVAFNESFIVLDGDRVVLAAADATFKSGSIALEAINLKGHFTDIRVAPL